MQPVRASSPRHSNLGMQSRLPYLPSPEAELVVRVNVAVGDVSAAGHGAVERPGSNIRVYRRRDAGVTASCQSDATKLHHVSAPSCSRIANS